MVAPVQSKQAQGSGTSLSVSFNTLPAIGNPIVAVLVSSGESLATDAARDNQTNTWTQRAASPGTNVEMAIHTAVANTSSGTFTVTMDPVGGSSLNNLSIFEYDKNSFDMANLIHQVFTDTESTTNAPATASASTTVTCTFIGGVSHSAGTISLTAGSGYTQLLEDESATNMPVNVETKSAAAGTHSFTWTLGSSVNCIAVGIALKEAAGGSAQTVSPGGVATAEAFGTATIVAGGVVIAPGGTASAEAFGTATIVRGTITLSPSGIATVEAFGAATIVRGGVAIAPSGIASAEAFGADTLLPGGVILAPSAIASLEAFGSHTIIAGGVVVAPSAIASAEAFGSHIIQSGGFFVAPTGISSGEAFGNHTIVAGGVVIAPAGIASAGAFGAHTLLPGGVILAPSAIASLEAFGSHTIIAGGVVVAPSAIASAEAFGSHLVLPGPVYVSPTGIITAEAFGIVTVDGGQFLILWPSREYTLRPYRRAHVIAPARRVSSLKPARRAFLVTEHRMQFAAKTPTEQPILAFNFANQLNQHAPGETIATASWAVTVKEGTDPSPSDMLTGMDPPTINGTHVLQKVRDGVAGVTYWQTATITTSQGQTLQLSGELKVDNAAASF